MRVWYTATATFVIEGDQSWNKECPLSQVRKQANDAIQRTVVLVQQPGDPAPQRVKARLVLDRLVLDAEALESDR